MQNKNKSPVGYSFIHFYLIGSECSPHIGILSVLHMCNSETICSLVIILCSIITAIFSSDGI